ncbi:GFA family protein [Sulfidibacter corallicola]|uniref:GFA family protein n=1 Tax=Sulfidibacter corallicola TaxID=2818388 RepID=A0A8A4TIF7_SULCO|nr:GFA family protein [Sulfidibacter corallicola]QTD49403.1 GFA family protein [Sulfidibacter corallicola]
MSEISEITGGCLCNGTRLTAKNVSKRVGACHCGTCRKWSGGPFMALDCGTEVTLEGEENITVFNSSMWAERGFCNKCGCHLFYRLKGNQQYIVPVGLLENRDEFEMDHQVFIDEKPEYYAFANETEDMTGAEVFAKYGPSAD